MVLAGPSCDFPTLQSVVQGASASGAPLTVESTGSASVDEVRDLATFSSPAGWMANGAVRHALQTAVEH